MRQKFVFEQIARFEKLNRKLINSVAEAFAIEVKTEHGTIGNLVTSVCDKHPLPPLSRSLVFSNLDKVSC